MTTVEDAPGRTGRGAPGRPRRRARATVGWPWTRDTTGARSAEGEPRCAASRRIGGRVFSRGCVDRSAHGGLPVTKHIFVTGGVASSLGKGITASSLGPPAQGPWPAGHDAEARPVHQRRSRHDEPVRARRGVRHRRRRRDRPRPRALRALHRREPHPGLQRHHRLDLLGGARRRAPRRLPRQDRAGDPAHHRRDQAPHHPPRRRRRRRRDHRGRRHGRRHRDPPVPRGDPAVPPRRRPRQRLLRPRHARPR